jgi:hypothetical protein
VLRREWHLLASACSLLLATNAPAQTSLRGTRLGAAAAAGRGRADMPRSVRARRADAPIVVDGRLTDAAWRSADVATEFVQQRPTPGAGATQRTEARVAFDAQAVYVSMRLFDTSPDSLLAPLGRRDYEGHGDWAHVLVDSYYDRRTAFHFAVTPSGTRRDVMISNDQEWSSDASWDAVWDVATSRDSLGWTAEFRIPLTQIRFNECRDDARRRVALARQPSSSDSMAGMAGCAWGIQFMRDVARTNERSVWAPIPPDAGGYVSLFGTLTGVDGVRAPRRLEVVPYSVARMTRSPGDAIDPFTKRTALGSALGADVGIGLTSTLTLTGTINPDFGQVEADPSEVNLSGFETFLRERRPFFVEGGNIFQYPLGDGWFFGEERLFYSRRIGRTPQVDDPDDADVVDRPDATTILGAAKVSGRLGGWTLGILDAVTGAERAPYVTANGQRGSFIAEPRTNYAVARLSRDFAGGRNSFGAIATSVHRDLDAYAASILRSSALTAGLDGRVRSPTRNYAFGGNIVASYVRGSAAAITETQRSSAHLFQRPDREGDPIDTTRTSLAGLSAELRASKQGGGHWRWGLNSRLVTSGFEVNDIGFQQRSNVVTASGWVGYSHFEPGRIVRRWELWSNHWTMRSLDGRRERLASNLFANVQYQSGWMVMGEARREFSKLSTTLLRGGPATYLPPNVGWSGRLVSDPRRVVSGEIMSDGYVDDAGGGRRIAVAPTVTVRPSARAQLSLQPAFAWVRNPAQFVRTASAAGDTSHVTGALSQSTASLTTRLDFTFTPSLSLQLYAQPFLSAGRYGSFAEVRDARATQLRERIAPFAPSAATPATGGDLRIDRGPGRSALTLEDPAFSVHELESNAVLRWEYRPGSALFLVWAQTRDEDTGVPDFSVPRQARTLWRADGTNVLLVKASYWFSR